MKAANQIQDPPSDSDTALVKDIPGIDDGELLLIPLAARASDGLLVTGDKNALLALASNAPCSELASALAGRVICVEQLLLALLAAHGFAWLHSRVQAAPTLDKGTAMIVTPGMSATEANARAGFRSFIEALRRETGGLLATALPL